MKFAIKFVAIFISISLTGAATLYNITEEPQSGPLYCHKCEESFKQWDPYTSCQIYPNTTPLVECLPSEPYCLVQRTSIKGMTTNIRRECTDECYYGCRVKNFGITTWSCTSCCRTSGCNIDNGSTQIFTCPIFYQILELLSFQMLIMYGRMNL